MPRNAQSERLRVTEAVERYLETLLVDPTDRVRPLSEAAIATALGMHRATIRKYAREQIAVASLKVAQRPARRTASAEAQQRIEKLVAERDAWRAKYDAIIEKWLRVEWALWQHPDLDFQELLKTEIPKPLRTSPGRTRRKY